MSDVKCFTVESEQDGQTLLALLRTEYPGLSWNACRKFLTGRRVAVNRVVCVHEARRMHPGDEVRVEANEIRPSSTAGPLLFHYVDEHLVVVDKPAGIVCTRRPEELHWPDQKKRLAPTLDELVVDRLHPASSKKRTVRPRAPELQRVQRLDRETSGVMVFARTVAAASGLIEQFSEHRAERLYHALVHGRLIAGTIRSHLVRDRGDGRRGSSPDGRHGVPAVTHVRPLEERAGVSRVECRLETGRTHQIRTHLSEQGNAVCGDRQYGVDDDAPRMALHAIFLAFVHPVTQQRMEFTSPWPKDLATWWNSLG
ncbi:MAG TPA: RluA family pseudouridine synthase [Planctomycetaceae bacterium]|nr:RluA family pseudouridine synthase [Planctomycetaceae bacterium]